MNRKRSNSTTPMKRSIICLMVVWLAWLSSPEAAAQDSYTPGLLRDELFLGTNVVLDLPAVEYGAINAATPGVTYTSALDFNQFAQIPPNDGLTNYVRHLSGVFVPPVTTNYVFWICSDDDSRLFLSTDPTPLQKRLIAQESNWSLPGQWTNSSGGSALAGKRSDQIIPPGFLSAPYAAGIPLTEGSKYYFEAYHHQAGGGDGFWVTYTYAGAPPPSGASTVITNDGVHTPNFGYLVHAATYLGVSVPSNLTVYADQTIAITATIFTDGTPEVPALQWFFNGAAIPNATNLTLNYSPPGPDTNQLFRSNGKPCTNNYVNASKPNCDIHTLCATNVWCPDTLTPTVASITCQASIATLSASGSTTVTNLPYGRSAEIPNGCVCELFAESDTGYFSRELLEVGNGPPDFGVLPGPTSLRYVPGPVDPAPPAGVYVARYRGLFSPPATAPYVFFLAAADDTDFYLSPDASLADKLLIAQESRWSNPLEWLNSSGGSTNSQKRSDTWSPDGGVTVPYGGGIWLTNGESYYFEAIQHHRGVTTPNFGFTAQPVGAADPTNGQPSAVSADQLWFLTRPTTTLLVATHPTNQIIVAGGAATFTGAAMSDGALTPLYQWWQNGTNLAGATASSLVLTGVSLAMNGYTYQWTAAIPGSSLSVTSAVATLTVTPAAACVPAPANLVLWLPFDETGGSASANLAAPAFPGTHVGAPTLVTGAYVVNSLGFNGVNQYVTVRDYPGLAIGTNSLTIDAWVNRATNAPDSLPSVIVDKRDVTTGVGYALSLSYGNLILTLNGADFRDAGWIPADGRWHFVAVTVHQAGAAPAAQFYVDGLVTSTLAVPAGNLANTNALWVGASPLGGNRPWLGGLDEIEIFDRALAASELLTIYQAGSAGKCRPGCVPAPANLALWLPFDETSGPRAANLAPGGSPGSLINGPTHDLTGFVDHSLSFSGGNQSVAVPSYAAINPGTNQDFSLDAWVKRPVGAPNSPPSVVLDKRDPVSHLGYSLSVDYGHVFLTMSGYNAADVTDQVPADGQWHFLAVTVARNQANGGHFYVDGNTPVAFTPVNVNLTTSAPFLVGESLTDPGANQPWTGGIDEVEYFNRALSAAEVRAIYQAGAAGKCKPACVAAPANLALWLPLDETAGTNSANLASPANPGTQVGSPTVNFGSYVVNSLTFNGVSQFITVPDYPAIEIGTNSLSIDAWVNRATNGPDSLPCVIVDKRDPSSGVGYSLSLSYGNLILTLNGVNYRDTGAIPPDGQWHFVAVTVNLDPSIATAQFFVDGAATSAVPLPPGELGNASDLWVGASPLGDNQPWWGGLDEIEIFNRALDPAELAAIYQAGPAGKCKPAGYPPLTVTTAPDQTVTCGNAWQFTPPQAASGCSNGAPVAVTSLGIVTNGTCPRTLTQSWQVADGCGNTALCRQTITIVDTVPPVLQCPSGAVVVPLGINGTLVVPAVSINATDNCTPAAQLLFAQSPPAGTVVPGPTVLVTVTVTDGCGNRSHCVVEVAGVAGGYGPQVLNGNPWSYLATGTNPGTAWRGLTFNAASWPTNAAPFGAGAFPHATALPTGHTTYYFLNDFWVPNAAAVTNLAVRYQRVAGLVIYLNGAEVVRNNLPTGTIQYTTLAVTNVTGAAETLFYTNVLNPAQLLTGNNVLAAEVHGSSATATDLGFQLELVAGNGISGPQRITALTAPVGATNVSVYYRNPPGALELNPASYTLLDAQQIVHAITNVTPGGTANEVLLNLAQPLAAGTTYQLTTPAAVAAGSGGGGPLPYGFATSVTGPEVMCPANVTAYVCDSSGQAFVDLNYGYFFGSGGGPVTYTWTDCNGPQTGFIAGTANTWFYTDFSDYFAVGSCPVQFQMGAQTCTTTVTVANGQDITTVNSAAVCAGGSVTLTANTTAPNPTYQWGDGETTASITVSPTATTVYTVTVLNGLTGCGSTGSATVTVNPAPVVTLPSGSICAGGSWLLTAIVSGGTAPYTYNWTCPPGVTPPTTATLSTGVAGTYSVQVTDRNGCTSGTATARLTVLPVPQVAVNSGVVCPGTPAVITASVTGGAGPFTYQWSGPSGALPGNSATLTIYAPGVYTATVTGPGGCPGVGMGAWTAGSQTTAPAWEMADGGGSQFMANASQQANGIAVDASGNSFVVGSFVNQAVFQGITGSPSVTLTAGYPGGSDAFVAKYNPAGALLWAVQANGLDAEALGVAVDASGNCFVTGDFNGGGRIFNLPEFKASIGPQCMFLACFQPNGTFAWAAYGAGFDAGNTRHVNGQGVAVDAAGNAYVAGGFQSKMSFLYGNPITQFSPDLLGNAAYGDAFLVKFNGAGEYQWAAKSTALTAQDGATGRGVAVDNQGHVWLVGQFWTGADGVVRPEAGIRFGGVPATPLGVTPAGYENAYVAQFATANGAALWAVQTTGVSGDYGSHDGRAIGVDAQGNCYFTAYFNGTAALGNFMVKDLATGSGSLGFTKAQLYDYFIGSLDVHGTPRWLVGGGMQGDNETRGLAVTPDGNVYVTGLLAGTDEFGAGGKNVLFRRYDATGTLRWSADGLATLLTHPQLNCGYGVAVDANGCVYATGGFNDPTAATDAGFFFPYFTSRAGLYAPNGAETVFVVKYCFTCGDASGSGVLVGNRVGDALILSWTGAGVRLQEAASLASGAWGNSALTVTQTLSGTTTLNTATAPIRTGTRFYRLVPAP